jgi:hypothetical protein
VHVRVCAVHVCLSLSIEVCLHTNEREFVCARTCVCVCSQRPNWTQLLNCYGCLGPNCSITDR